jgi:hypothetical protein
MPNARTVRWARLPISGGASERRLGEPPAIGRCVAWWRRPPSSCRERTSRSRDPCLPNSGGGPPGDDAESPGGKRPTQACGATWLPMAGDVAPDGTMPDSRLRDARLPIPGGARPEGGRRGSRWREARLPMARGARPDGGRRGSRWWTFPSITIAGASTSSFAISEATMWRLASIIRSCSSRSKRPADPAISVSGSR